MTETPNLPPRTTTEFANSDRYRSQVHKRIVGGAHTYSKGDDQFPALSPAAIARGRGGRVWDIDGNEYVDCGLGLGSVSLGHAYEPVLAAVREQLELGSAFQRPASIELDLAGEFLALTPGMERIKFAKNGSNVTTAAVKLSRAFTGRPLVAFPKNHPVYSFDDWFIGRSAVASGVPEPIVRLSVTYDSTRPETLAQLFRDYPGQIACVITEPEETLGGSPDTIRAVQRLARDNNAIFILDEMVTGFRAGFPGCYTNHGFEPDLVTWGKAVGNGFSFCALTGRADVMDLGGIGATGRERVFLLSSTHGGETHTLAAARAVIREYRERNVIERHRELVSRVVSGMRSTVHGHGLDKELEIHASPWRVVTVCRDGTGAVSADLRTLLLQEMIGRGILFQGVYLPCFTHSDADVAQILRAFDAAAAIYRHALDHGIDGLLIGQAVRPVFRKYAGCRETCPAYPCPHESRCRAAI
ncbi:MAG: glutamate-1-semialdehyde 2,1-aminomutase [Alphaproteobacteria bacterium]